MVEISIDDSSEIVAHAIDVYEQTGSLVAAIEAAKPMLDAALEVAIFQALASVLGGASQ